MLIVSFFYLADEYADVVWEDSVEERTTLPETSSNAVRTSSVTTDFHVQSHVNNIEQPNVYKSYENQDTSVDVESGGKQVFKISSKFCFIDISFAGDNF